MNSSRVTFTYKNHRGEISTRLVEPKDIIFSSNIYHREWQWLLNAYDCNKEAIRTFAMKDITDWQPVA